MNIEMRKCNKHALYISHTSNYSQSMICDKMIRLSGI